MWRSSRSERHNEPRRCGPGRGFTLLEAMVSLLLLVIVLIVAMTMLFQMRAFAERQQYFMLPRQTARRAADYLSYYFAGASDANYVDSTHQSPNALIMYYNLGGAVTQASYNNLTDAEPGNSLLLPSGLRPANTSTAFGDIGTDVITMVTPFSSPGRYQVFAPFPALGTNVDLWFNYRVGCAAIPPPSPDAANQAKFQADTGFDGTQSALLMLVDGNGNWSYVRIPSTGYLTDGLCSDTATFKNIHVRVDTASPTLPAAPNPAASPVASLTDPVYLVTGLQVISFRVLTDDVDGLPKLQQKLGLFDPNTDNPGTDFTNVMENVEDLQVAYIYSHNAAANVAAGAGGNPLVWNTGYVDAFGVRHNQTIDSDAVLCPGCTTHVPYQAGPSGTPPPLDISNVIGVRVSVTGRSPLLPLAAQKLTNVGARDPLAADPSQTPSQHFRPASEDHAVTMDTVHPTWPKYDLFDHYRATATLLLRNRIPRG